MVEKAVDLYCTIGSRRGASKTRMVRCTAGASLMTGTYYFDQFNVKVDMATYTDEEYEKYLQGITIVKLH